MKGASVRAHANRVCYSGVCGSTSLILLHFLFTCVAECPMPDMDSSYCEWRVSLCFPSTRQSFPCDKLQRWKLYLPAPSWRIAWKRVCYKMPVRRLEGSQCFRLHERLQKVSWIHKQRENMIGKNWMRSYANEDGEKNARCVPRQLGSIEGLSISPSAEDYSIHLS